MEYKNKPVDNVKGEIGVHPTVPPLREYMLTIGATVVARGPEFDAIVKEVMNNRGCTQDQATAILIRDALAVGMAAFFPGAVKCFEVDFITEAGTNRTLLDNLGPDDAQTVSGEMN